MKTLVVFIGLMIGIGFVDTFSSESTQDLVNSLDQNVYEYICIRLDDPSADNVWEYYCTHRAECDSIMIINL